MKRLYADIWRFLYDKTEIPISSDIGFDDIVYPDRVKMEFPVLLEMDVPLVYTYSICSVISEKFEAIVSLGNANSRYKDFYDIYVLACKYDLDGFELKEAVKEAFEHRGTKLNDLFAFTDEFTESEIHKTRWNAFLKKKKTLVNASLNEVVDLLKVLLLPIVKSIANNTTFECL